MTKSLITRNQRRLLDGVCDYTTFEDQVKLAGEIWPYKFNYMRKCWSRLQNLGFIEWINQGETYYECRWTITLKGLDYLRQTDG